MLFRVLFSNDIDEYYKKNPVDVQLSMTVQASSFENATLTAKALLESYVFWPSIFEVVSVEWITPEEEAEVDIWTSKDAQYFIPEEPVKKASELWCLQTGIVVLDPDGWDRLDYQNSWYELITRDEFLDRAMRSTCKRWPQPLHDE